MALTSWVTDLDNSVTCVSIRVQKSPSEGGGVERIGAGGDFGRVREFGTGVVLGWVREVGPGKELGQWATGGEGGRCRGVGLPA